ncbi:MAG: type II secretion system F family protein [Patescibacteria group bacterium]
MAKRFKYKLGDKVGVEAKGILEAESETDAIKKLTALGHSVISIREISSGGLSFWEKPSLSFEDKLLFTKHLATMLRAGITITESLQILASQTTQTRNREMYESIVRSVKAGQSLSESLKVYDTVFSDLFINMIATGEKSGTLDQILDYLDEQLDKEYELRKKVISAFIYPAVILSITMMLSLGIVFFIMPKITKIFSSFEITLPLPTRLLIGFSSLMTDKPLITFGAAALMLAGAVFLLKWKRLKPFWDWVSLHLPVFGRVLHYANLARFARTLTSLLQAGMPITKALNVISTMMTNTLYKNAVKNSAAKVEQGGQLGEAFEGQEKLFPILVVKMLYVGEKTGSLETTMKQLALLYERNVDGLTRNLTVLLEPLLLVFMGMMVGGVAISIILPIYQLPNLISQ